MRSFDDFSYRIIEEQDSDTGKFSKFCNLPAILPLQIYTNNDTNLKHKKRSYVMITLFTYICMCLCVCISAYRRILNRYKIKIWYIEFIAACPEFSSIPFWHTYRVRRTNIDAQNGKRERLENEKLGDIGNEGNVT